MKTIATLALVLIAVTAMAKPLPPSVSSWEGDFIRDTSSALIRIRGLPMLLLWRYRLQSGSEGTALAFSNEKGDMLLAPAPNEDGVQPFYADHFVSVNDDKTADIFVIYSVQGNGGWLVVEKYHYDGKTITLQSTTLNGGKPDFEWFAE